MPDDSWTQFHQRERVRDRANAPREIDPVKLARVVAERREELDRRKARQPFKGPAQTPRRVRPRSVKRGSRTADGYRIRRRRR